MEIEEFFDQLVIPEDYKEALYIYDNLFYKGPVSIHYTGHSSIDMTSVIQATYLIKILLGIHEDYRNFKARRLICSEDVYSPQWIPSSIELQQENNIYTIIMRDNFDVPEPPKSCWPDDLRIIFIIVFKQMNKLLMRIREDSEINYQKCISLIYTISKMSGEPSYINTKMKEIECAISNF